MKLLILFSLLTVFSACQPKKNPVRAAQINGVTPGIVSAIGIGTCAQGMNTVQGIIFELAQPAYAAGDATGAFEDRVKALLSASMMPQDIGMISGQMGASTGIRFTGSIKLDQAGNVVATNSKLTVSIYDSIWLQEYSYNSGARGIDLAFDAAKAGHTIQGQFNLQTGVGSLTAKDAFGEIRLEGKIDAQNFSGIVKWQNSVSVIGSPTKGTLGSFTIPRCALLQ